MPEPELTSTTRDSRAPGELRGETTIRSAAGADADRILEIYSHFVFRTSVTFETEPPTAEEMRIRVEQALHKHVWLVCERGEQLLGYAYGAPFHSRSAYRWSAEVSVYVHPDAQGQGMGRALLERVLEVLRERGYVNAFAGIALPNPASVALFESHGFEQIALQKEVGFKRGRWHDVGWWQLRLAPASIPPPTLK
jgi:L-amino acid N-acyltransferase YncA